MSRERWTPARFVPEGVVCDFCWQDIPKASPGHKSGTRGTKAFYNPDRAVWESMGCRLEGSRAEGEREKLDDARRAQQGGMLL